MAETDSCVFVTSLLPLAIIRRLCRPHSLVLRTLRSFLLIKHSSRELSKRIFLPGWFCVS